MLSKSEFEGACTCGEVRYRMHRAPMFVHCCHCRWCQRETGSAFALNGLLEATELSLLKGQVEVVDTPSNSGRGQRISRCPNCRIALWSNYSGAGEAIHFVRLGTLDDPDTFPPDIHIFTASRQPWVNLAGGAPAVPEYYQWKDYWPSESVERYNAALGK
jgi:hypothetical protein